MLIRGILRFNTNLSSNRLSFPAINSMYHSRFHLRNIQASVNVTPESKKAGEEVKYGESCFRKYIQENNNFKYPASKIMSLDFPHESKYDSLKLLHKLKENLQDYRLWKEILDCLKEEIGTFDVEDFLKIIALASSVRIHEVKGFHSDFVACLDNELKRRKFEFDDALEILFVLRHTLLRGKTLKCMRFYLRFNRKLDKLQKFKPVQVIHIFYHLEDLGEAKSVYRSRIMKYLEANLSQFNAVEIGIVFAGLSRASLFSRDDQFLKQVTDKLFYEINSLDSVHFFYASKFLRGCSSFQKREIIMNFQEKLIPYVSKFNVQALVGALLLNYPYSLNLCLWDNVMEQIKPQLKTLNIVDIQRLTSITIAFKVKDEELLKFAVELVEENQYLDKYFGQFLRICKNLVVHRIYRKKLLDIVLSRDFIYRLINRSFANEMAVWAFLNYCLQLDKPEYQCTCLDNITEKKILNKLFAIRTLNKSDVNLPMGRKKLYNILKEMYGNDKVNESFCLPHFERGIILRFDENLKPTPPGESVYKSKEIVKAPLDEHYWFYIMPVFSRPEGFSPLLETCVRHITACGYTPVLVPHEDFYHYQSLDNEKLKKYLADLVEKKLQEVSQEKQKQK